MKGKKFKGLYLELPESDNSKLEEIVRKRYASKVDFVRTKIREEII